MRRILIHLRLVKKIDSFSVNVSLLYLLKVDILAHANKADVRINSLLN